MKYTPITEAQMVIWGTHFGYSDQRRRGTGLDYVKADAVKPRFEAAQFAFGSPVFGALGASMAYQPGTAKGMRVQII